MYEGIGPRERHRGLYDEMADNLKIIRLEVEKTLLNSTSLPCTQSTILMDIFNNLVELTIIALRHDNAQFNEARFRQRISCR